MTPTDPALNAHKSILAAMAEAYRTHMNDWLQSDSLLSREEASERAMAAACRVAAEMLEAQKTVATGYAAQELKHIAEQAND